MATKRTTLLRITKRKDGSTQISGTGETAALLLKLMKKAKARKQGDEPNKELAHGKFD
jgi:hypothetical protein